MIQFSFRLVLAFIVLVMHFVFLIGAKDIISSVSGTEMQSSTHSTALSEIDLDQFKIIRNFECNIHENCTSRLFSLDTYCCVPANYCCNWFEFMMKYKSPSTTTLPYKSPSLVTIFTLLILIICLLFISYCICILFCYYFKCGLFKKPKVVVISSSSSSNRGYRHRRNYAREFDSTSTEIMHQQPKLSSNESHNSSRRTSHSSSSLSSASSSYSITQHRSNLQSKLKNKKSSISTRNHNEPKTPVDSKNYKRTRTSRDEFISRSVDNYPHSKTKALASSRTTSNSVAGASSSKRSKQHSSTRRQQRNLYADPECYIDYENESPFLLPSKRSSSATGAASSTNSKTKQSNSSSSKINKRRRTSSNNNRQSGHNSPSFRSNSKRTSPRRSSSTNSQHNARRSTASDHSYGTAVALVDIDLLRNPTSRLETVEASSASSSRSSLSRLSGSSELLASLAGGERRDTAHVRVNQQSIGVDLIANSDTEITASSLLLSSGGATVSATVTNYYQDEKPPSYDEIIRQNN